MMAAAQWSFTTTKPKVSSTRLRPVEETHWLVKIPDTTTSTKPLLKSSMRWFIVIRALLALWSSDARDDHLVASH